MERVSVPAGCSYEELCKELVEAVDPGPEYRSSQEWTDLWGKNRSTANALIRKLVAAGKMEKRWRTAWKSDGSVYRMPVYKVV